MSMIIISVIGNDVYDIMIGCGVFDWVFEVLVFGVWKIFVVYLLMFVVWVVEFCDWLFVDMVNGQCEVFFVEIFDVEQGKCIEVVVFCWQVMGQVDFMCSDVVVGYGGGVVIDFVGFVVVMWFWGVQLVQVFIMVFGFVDVFVGGKIGVNIVEGKNLVGVFWVLSVVIGDLDELFSFSLNEVIVGFVEVVKVGFIWVLEIFDIIEVDLVCVVDMMMEEFCCVVELVVDMKVKVVLDDFCEVGFCEIFNYGYMFGYVIEYVEWY